MTREHLHEALRYDPSTGTLTWKYNRPSHHFPSDRELARWNSRYAGKMAGSVNDEGYAVVNIGGKRRKAHRVAWIMTHGDIPPKGQIDHINGNRADNRIANLRLATRAENSRNSLFRSDNKSGHRGVVFDETRAKWKACINVNGRTKHLGTFGTPEEASSAYRSASIHYHGAFSPYSG